MRKRFLRFGSFAFLVTLLVMFLGSGVLLASYPQKPVTIIVPWSAGGGTDVGVRIMVKYMARYFKEPFVVVNIPGGGSEVGVAKALKSPPDGYTICAFNSASIILATLRRTVYHPVNDVEPICLMVSDPRLFAVRADDARFKTAQDFINYAKKNPGELTIATSGAGTSGHLSILVLEKACGVKITTFHLGSGGETRLALLGGYVDAVAESYGEVFPALKEGKIRVIAVATGNRMPELPDVPTLKEIGVNLVISSNRGFVAPKGTPRDVINELAWAFKKVAEDPDFQREMSNVGLKVKYLGPEEWGELIKYEYELYSRLVKELGLKL